MSDELWDYQTEQERAYGGEGSLEGAAPPPAFRVDDDGKAEWAIRKLARIRSRQHANEDLADGEIQRVREWLHDVQKPLENDAQYFTGLLTDYAIMQRQEDDRKTVSLPHGKLRSTERKPGVEISDPAALTEWALAVHPEAVETRHSVPKSALNRIAAVMDGEPRDVDTGERVPGVETVPGRVTVTVTTEG